MGFFSSLLGGGSKKAMSSSVPIPLTPAEEVKRQIETTEGELHEATEQLAQTADIGIKSSLEAVVARKTQALGDLQEKLKRLQ